MKLLKSLCPIFVLDVSSLVKGKFSSIDSKSIKMKIKMQIKNLRFDFI